MLLSLQASRLAGDGILESPKKQDLCYSKGTFDATLCSGSSVFLAPRDMLDGRHVNAVAVTHPPCKFGGVMGLDECGYGCRRC